MGHAARLKQQQRAAGERTTAGNPEPFQQTVRFIRHDRQQEAAQRGAAIAIPFSDREYVMDARGVLHRQRPTPPIVSISHSHPEPSVNASGV